MNYENIEIQDLESSIECWMLGNLEDAKENLGEDIVYAVQEVLDHG
jgi:hypothetical protein